jgi:hypothetical protein
MFLVKLDGAATNILLASVTLEGDVKLAVSEDIVGQIDAYFV